MFYEAIIILIPKPDKLPRKNTKNKKKAVKNMGERLRNFNIRYSGVPDGENRTIGWENICLLKAEIFPDIFWIVDINTHVNPHTVLA